MTRRNTYVCSERNSADRNSMVQNGKENRYELRWYRYTSDESGSGCCNRRQERSGSGSVKTNRKSE